jgi:hypothetical protein
MKKKTSKKVSKPQQLISLSRSHIMVKRGVVSYLVIGLIAILGIVLILGVIAHVTATGVNESRLKTINSIYSSLNLGDSYRSARSDIFGDKRVYSWDKSRTYSSSIEYAHNDTVSATVADLKSKIEAAGFTQFETAYDGSVNVQYHFKNSKNQYIRVSVVPKSFEDMMVYGDSFLSTFRSSDQNAAPSYVTIKVNLDDNNE